MPELPRQDAAITAGTRWALTVGGRNAGVYTHGGLDERGLVVLRGEDGEELRITRGNLRYDKRWELLKADA